MTKNQKPNRLARIQQLRDELTSLTANPYDEEQLFAHIGSVFKEQSEYLKFLCLPHINKLFWQFLEGEK